MEIIDRIHSGLSAGVDRHWRYTKELLNIKPEYLMTVAVADELTKGYDGISGLDVEIRLELSTKRVAYTIVTDATSLKVWFQIQKSISISRHGRVDILATSSLKSHLIELKGFDPGKSQIDKELVRIQELFTVNSGDNSLVAGHIAFPSQRNCEKRLNKYGQELIAKDSSLKYIVESKQHETKEDPEDGIPIYYTNSLSVVRSNA